MFLLMTIMIVICTYKFIYLHSSTCIYTYPTQCLQTKTCMITHMHTSIHNPYICIHIYTHKQTATQVPQFVLDDPEIGPSCRIVVTQPRRLSAISVAERIASERGKYDE